MEDDDEDDETITISKKEYNEMKHDSDVLSALYRAGVDNWDGYDYAMEMLEDNK
jgi:hypothetical protein